MIALKSTLSPKDQQDMEDALRLVVYKFCGCGLGSRPVHNSIQELVEALEMRARSVAKNPAVTYEDARTFLLELAGIRVTHDGIAVLGRRFAWVEPWKSRLHAEQVI